MKKNRVLNLGRAAQTKKRGLIQALFVCLFVALGFTGPDFVATAASRMQDDNSLPEPIAMWTFEEGEGTQIGDASGNGHLGLLANGPSFSTDTPPSMASSQYALALDGIDDYAIMDISTDFNLTEEVTLAAWVKLDDGAKNQKVIGKVSNEDGDLDGYLLSVINNQIYPEFWEDDGRSTWFTSGTVPDNTWTHIAATWTRGGELVAYVNGVEVNRQLTIGVNPLGVGCEVVCQVVIGTVPWAPTIGADQVGGLVDDIVIFDKALTETQVARLTTTLIPAGAPLGHWKFDEASGTTVLDSSGFGHDGTIVGSNVVRTPDVPAGPGANVGSLDLVRDQGYVEIADQTAFDLEEEVTLAVWVKLDDASLNTKIIGKAGFTPAPSWGYVLSVIDNKIYPEFWNVDGGSNYMQSGFVPNNQWTHLAVTWERGENMIAYINGLEVDRMAASNSKLGTGCEPKCNFVIGTLPWAPFVESVGGGVDEAMVFSEALDADQIWALSQAGDRPTGPTLPSIPENVNNPPIVIDDAVTIDEDTKISIDVLGNDSDIENNPLTLVSVGLPKYGSAEIVDNKVLYTPIANYYGKDSFYYGIEDGESDSVEFGVVRVTVNPVNDAPSGISIDNGSIPENKFPDNLYAFESFIGYLSTSDPDNSEEYFFYRAETSGANNNDQFVVYNKTPILDTVFPNPFPVVVGVENRPSLWLKGIADHETTPVLKAEVAVQDAEGAEAVEIFEISVTDQNDAPNELTTKTFKVDENSSAGTLVGTLSASDPDAGQTVSFYTNSTAFEINGDQLLTKQSFDYEAQDHYIVDVEIVDNLGATKQDSLVVNIGDLDDGPPNSFAYCTGQTINLINSSAATVAINNVQVSNNSTTGCNLTGVMSITIRGTTISNLGFIGQVDQNNRLKSSSIDDFSYVVGGLEMYANDVAIQYHGSKPRLAVRDPRLQVPSAWRVPGAPSISLKNQYGQINQVVITNYGLDMGGTFQIPTIKTTNGLSLELKGSLQSVDGGYEIAADGKISIPNIGKKSTRRAQKGQTCSINAGVTLFVANGANMMSITEHPATQVNPINDLEAVNSLSLRRVTAGFECSQGIPIANTGLYLTALQGTIELYPTYENVSVNMTIKDKAEIIEVEGGLTLQWAPAFEIGLRGSLEILSYEMARASATVTERSFSVNLTIKQSLLDLNFEVNAWVDRYNKFHFTGSGTLSVDLSEGAIWEECGSVPYPSCSGDWPWEWECTIKYSNVCISIPPVDFGKTKLAGAKFGEFTNRKYGATGYVTIAGVDYGVYADEEGEIVFGDVSNYHLVSGPRLMQARAAQRAWQASGEANPLYRGSMPYSDEFSFPDDKTVILNAPIGLAFTEEGMAPTQRGPNVIEPVDLLADTDVAFSLISDGYLDFSIITPEGTKINGNNADVQTDYTVRREQLVTYVGQDGNEANADLGRVRVVLATQSSSYDKVDVRIDGALTWDQLSNQNPTGFTYVEVVTGTHTVEMLAAGTNTVLDEITIDVAAGEDITLMDLGNTDPELFVFADNNLPTNKPGEAKLRLVTHSTLDPTMQFHIDGEAIASGLTYGRLIDYVTIPAGLHTLELRDPLNGRLLAEKVELDAVDGATYTVMPVDFTHAGYDMTLIYLMDELYTREIETTYYFDQATKSPDWKAEISGNVEDINFIVSVSGPTNSPILEDLMVARRSLSDAQVSWHLTTDYNPTDVSVYITEGPITRTIVSTDTLGTVTEEVVAVYDGQRIDTYTLTDTNELDGSLVTRDIDLSGIESGDYYIWIEANDGINPAVRGYVTSVTRARSIQPDAVFGVNTVQLSRDGYSELRQLQAAAVVTLDQSATFPTDWDAAIRTELDEDNRLYVEWDANPHPDIDSYTLLVETEINGEPTLVEIAAGGSMLDADETGELDATAIGFETLNFIEPGMTYKVRVRAEDETSDRSVVSDPVTVSFGTGDFTLKAADSVQVAVGRSKTVAVQLNELSSLFYPNVNLTVDSTQLPRGVTAWLGIDPNQTYSLSNELMSQDLIITVDETVELGTFTVTVIGQNGQLSRSIDIDVQVGEGGQIYLPMIKR